MATTTANTDQQATKPAFASQISDFAKKYSGQAGPLADKAKGFAKQRPAATAALLGVVGIAVLNTLRGRQ